MPPSRNETELAYFTLLMAWCKGDRAKALDVAGIKSEKTLGTRLRQAGFPKYTSVPTKQQVRAAKATLRKVLK